MKTTRVMLVLAVCMAVAFSASCQSWLSESEVESIVQEEVERELAGQMPDDVSSIVQAEVERQLAGLVQDIVAQVQGTPSGFDAASVVQGEVAKQLASLDELTLSTLRIRNESGMTTAVLTTRDDGGYLLLTNADGQYIVKLESEYGTGDGKLSIHNAYGDEVATLRAYNGDGTLRIWDADGLRTYTAP